MVGKTPTVTGFRQIFNCLLYDDFFSLFQATSRAILGEKAYEYLKKGKQIPDQLLVDITVDAIR